MSETEIDYTLDTSDATLEGVKFENVLGALQLAAQDAKQSKDFLSYSTVIDIYLSDPSRYSDEEKEELLSHLLAVLSEDSDLVFEIGWDLPSLLIPFIDSDYDMTGTLREAPCVYKVLKLFELLAHNGNPKELFLKCTELLNTVKMSDSAKDDNPDLAQKFYNVKLYCIFELIDSCLRRIRTLYPLRFLGMTVTSFINSIYINPVTSASGAAFVWKRLYSFARNYTRPPVPDQIDATPEELEKINADEDYLQRKLLTGFLTEAINLVLQRSVLGFSVSYYNHLQLLLPVESKVTVAYELNTPVLDRLYELALSFDMDLSQSFENFIKSSDALLNSTITPGKLDDEFTGEMFETLVVDYQKTFAHTLVDTQANEVKDSLGGALNLYIYSVGSKGAYENLKVSVLQAVHIGLRVIVPGLVHKSFINRGLHDASIFLAWVAMLSSQSQLSIELELAKIPSVMLRSYFQSILFVMISSNNDLFFRYVSLTLLTKFLSLSPETVSYDFMINCFTECPYDNVKAALVGVFKELVTKGKLYEDSLSDSLKGVSIAKGDKSAPPPLPVREKAEKGKYITLTEDRIAELFQIVHDSIDSTFLGGESGPTLAFNYVPTLLAFLNLLVLLKHEKLVPLEQTKEVIEKMLKHIDQVESKWKDDASQSAIINTIGILNVTVDRLKD